MFKQMSKSLLFALVLGVAIVGCGGGSSTSSSQSSSTPAPSSAASGTSSATTSTVTTSGTTSPTTSTSKPGTSTPATGTPAAAASAGSVSQLAETVCKHGIPASASLPPSVKAKLAHICNLAASGHIAASQEAARKACLEEVGSPAVPAGPAKEKALAACTAK